MKDYSCLNNNPVRKRRVLKKKKNYSLVKKRIKIQSYVDNLFLSFSVTHIYPRYDLKYTCFKWILPKQE